MRLLLVSFLFITSSHSLVGCVTPEPDERDLGCEDSQCNSPPQNGCDDSIAVGFSQLGRCDRGKCVYEQIQTHCGEGTVCLGGVCMLEMDSCHGVVCENPPDPTCNASDVVTYFHLGECLDGECLYEATYTPCGSEKVCMNAHCYSSDDPCASIVCDSPPERRCDGNAVKDFDDDGMCSNGQCIYPVTETPCGESATCIDGQCDDSVHPCAGIECTTPPNRTCAGNIVIVYVNLGICQEGVCRYSATEESCASTEVCLEGACLDPCMSLTCLEPPASRCSGNDLYSYSTEGTCLLGECFYEETVTPCGAGKLCHAGACHFTPGKGDLVITEIMYDVEGGDGGHEWFEVHNPTDHPLYLGGLVIRDNPSSEGSFNELILPDGMNIEMGGYLVFAQSESAMEEGIAHDWSEYGTFLLANNDDEIILTFNNEVVEKVEYNENTTFPEAKGVSLSLDPSRDASSNDDGEAWCFGVTPYHGSLAINSPESYGSPGIENPPCDFMCFQVECPTLPNSCISPTVARQFSGPGVCDSTTSECLNDQVQTDLDCVLANDNDLNYVCHDGECIDGCEGVYCITAPIPTCIGNSVVSYVNLGACTAGLCEHEIENQIDCGLDTCVEVDGGAQCEGDPCEGVSCDAPPTWCDGRTIVDYTGPGSCEGGSCNFRDSEIRNDCSSGHVCYEDACVRVPQVGELIISEYLSNPSGSDTGKEWFEVYNPLSESLYLGGLVVKDADVNLFVVPDGVFVSGNSYFVFGAGPGAIADELDFDWSTIGAYFQLANDQDEIILEYDGLVIDSVAYADCEGCFPDPNGASVSLEPTLMVSDNNVGNHWCNGQQEFGVGESRGTPGFVNTPCFACTDETECPPAENSCLGATEALQYGLPSCQVDFCDYSSAGRIVDCEPQVCLNGACVNSPD